MHGSAYSLDRSSVLLEMSAGTVPQINKQRVAG